MKTTNQGEKPCSNSSKTKAFISFIKSVSFSVLFVFGSLSSHETLAQESDEGTSANDLAKELANPNATRGQMFTLWDIIPYNGNLENANQQTGYVFSFQPSLPIPLAEGTNLFVRPLIPIYFSQPAFGEDGFENKGGLGNISADVAIGKTWPSKWMTLVGVFAGFPTATNEQLRSNFTTMGPEAVVGKVTSFGFLGILVNHAWSLNSQDADAGSLTILPDMMWTATGGRNRASVTAGQYFYVVNLKNAWQISAAPTYAYNHTADEGNRLTLPIGTGISKVVSFGKLPVKLGFQYWYYVASPENFGPQQQFRFQIAPVIPLPW